MGKPKLTTAIATQMVERIEVLQAKIDDIYAEAEQMYAGSRHSNVIRDAVKARKEMREVQFIAEGYLASFDVPEDETN